MSKCILVCGGRKYDNHEMVDDILREINGRKTISVLIEGGATGADTLAREWAEDNVVPCLTVPADWDRYGNSAGPIRNAHMLKIIGLPDLVVAFPGQTGTADMVKKAHQLGVVVFEVDGHESSARQMPALRKAIQSTGHPKG